MLYNPLIGCSPLANYHFQMGVTIIGFAEYSGPGLNPVTNNSKFLFSFISLLFWSCSAYFAYSFNKSIHKCIMKNLSKNWWVLEGLEPRTTDPKSSMFAPRPILEKTINFYVSHLSRSFRQYFMLGEAFKENVLCKYNILSYSNMRNEISFWYIERKTDAYWWDAIYSLI